MKRLLTFVVLAVMMAVGRAAEAVIPQLGKSYYIAAQTWDGKQYVERLFVNTSGGTVEQQLAVSNAAKWTISGRRDSDGAIIIKSPVGKRLMRGGISSGDVYNTVKVPSTWSVADHPEGAVVIQCRYDNKYIIARNDGSNMASNEATSNEAGYNPKTAAYTQYFKFYDADLSYLTVASNYGSVGAVFEFVPDDGEANLGQPLRGNLWEMEAGTLSVVQGSYDDTKFLFRGFRVNGGELQETVHTGQLSGNTNVQAVFEYLMFCDRVEDADLDNGKKWQHIAANANVAYHLGYESDELVKTMQARNVDAEEWCFVGTDESFVIYNKAAGPTKVLTAAGTANGSLLTMADYAEGNPLQQWTLTSTSTSIAFTLKSAPNAGLNQISAGGQARIYTATDANSRWQLRKREYGTTYRDRESNVIVDGAKYTFLCSFSSFYARQKVMKAIYLNATDGKLYWKTYDPNDDAFYFKAHVDYGLITMESVAKPGYYLTGATTAADEIGNLFTVNQFDSKDCNIYVNGGNPFHANNHGGGGGGGSNIINYPGGANGASSWYVQRADNKSAEATRYQQELKSYQDAIDEANRLAAREQLNVALGQVFVGNALGQTPQEAWDAAKAVYDDVTKSLDEYNTARTALLNALNVPVVGSYYAIQSVAEWTDGRARRMHVGKGNAMRWEVEKPSLYQIWMVAAKNEDAPTRLGFLNVGATTFLKAQYSDANLTTTTSGTEVLVNLVGAGDGVFKIQSLTASNNQNLLSAGQADGGNAIEGNIALNNSANNLWRIIEISEADMSMLADSEDERQAARDSLRRTITEVRSQLTTQGAIGYYNNLDLAIDAAQNIFADETNIESEYLDAITALRAARAAATPVLPDAEALYTLSLQDGSQSLHLVNPSAEDAWERVAMRLFDDTGESQLWTVAHKEGQTYTFSNNGVSIDITLTLAGRDAYRIAGLDGLFVIRPGQLATPRTDVAAGIYRVVNVATGKVLANNGTLVARTRMADVDETNTNFLQLWTIEKKSGADRYTLRNHETNRYLDQEAILEAIVPTTPHAIPWKFVPGDNAGEYRLVTTEGMSAQYVMSAAEGSLIPTMAEMGAEGDLWRFEAAVPVVLPEKQYQVYTFCSGNKNTYMCATGTTAEQRPQGNLPAEVDRSRWALIPYDFVLADGRVQTRYGIRNYFSGLYIQNVTSNNGVVSAGVTPVYFEVSTSTQNPNGVYFKSPTNTMYLNCHGGNNTIIGYNQPDLGSTWIVNVVEGVTTTEREMMEKADAYEGFIAPSDGLICRIVNHSIGSHFEEDYKTMAATANGYNEAKEHQLWRLNYDEEEAMYTIENLLTGDYVKNQTVAADGRAYTMTSDVAEAGHFSIATNPAFVGQRIYNILDGVCGKAVFQNGTTLQTGEPSATAEPSAAEWRFKQVEVSNEDIAAMRKKFDDMKHITEHVAEYRVIFDRIFEDKACTQIKSTLSEAQFEKEMASLPEMLSNICRKVKNDSWPLSANGRGWEKAFRVQNYSVVSNTGFANAWWKGGYGMSQLNDPCGITAKAGDVIAVMLDRDAPVNSALRLFLVQGFNIRANYSYELKTGLNLIQVPNDCNLFVAYHINSTADDPRYYLDKFPDIKVHIEGGTVIGQLDRTKDLVVEKADNLNNLDNFENSRNLEKTPYTYLTTTREGANELWHDMLEDGLVRNGYMSQIKSRNVYFHFNANSVANTCPDKIGEVTDIWDWMLDAEWWLMGINNRPDPMHIGKAPGLIDTYIPNLSKRFNGRWIAAERTGGYMNGQQGGGTQYNTSTIANIMNFNNMASGGGQWGPAHEFGHCHQSPINMCGCKETSNNLYSNVVTWEFGRQMSRGESMTKVSDVYGRGGHWFDIGIWAATQMYYKLYLYYHVAGNKPTFYQEVHQRLRQDRLGGNLIQSVDRDYLHFALVCSEVAGEDLSDFFECYGMFKDVTPENSLPGAVFEEKTVNGKTYNCRKFADYSTYYMYSTPEMIADYKARIQACGPKNTNIIFIDDRFLSEAVNEWAAPGEMRGMRDKAAGSQGNLGDWRNFTPEAQAANAAPVGYRIYDEDGNLLYFTATTDANGEPVIPQAVKNHIIETTGSMDNIVIAEVDNNNDVIEQASEEDEVYTLTTYSYDKGGNYREHTVNSAGRLKPMLSHNEILVVSKRAEGNAARIRYSRNAAAAASRLAGQIADYKFANEANVIINNDGQLTMNTLDITDKVSLYLPKGADDSDVQTLHVNYSRTNTAGWNSVCLPFALTSEALPEGSKIFVLKDCDGESITLMSANSVQAAEPCYVFCPEGVNSWDIDIDIDDYTTTTLNVTNPTATHISGSFENRVIGEGKYKLDGTGTVFGRTSANGSITAFRSYIEPGKPSNVKRFILRVEDSTVDGIQVVNHQMSDGQYYDLSGYPISTPQPGRPYIYNGKVLIYNGKVHIAQ